MGRCCGGKNAGKPITQTRWHIGRGIFLGYHLFVQCLMLMIGVLSPKVRRLAEFHRQYVRELWQQISGREGIKVIVTGDLHSAATADRADVAERPAS